MASIKSEDVDDTVLLGKDSPEPFNNEKGDIILRTSDNVRFRVFKSILGLASPIFADMLSIPQSPPENRDPGDYVDGIPCVPISEDSKAIDLLMRFLYPMDDPPLDSIEDFRIVLGAALKYQMDFLTTKLRVVWLSIVRRAPFRAFATACRMAWEEEAHTAARLCLEEPIWPLRPPLPDEFKLVTADIIIRFIDYHRQCAEAAHTLAVKHDWLARAMDGHRCNVCQRSEYSGTGQAMKMGDWLDEYMRRVAPLLLTNPTARTVRENSDLVEKSIRQIFQTEGTCEMQVHVRGRINYTVDLFVREVENAVSNVPLDLAF